MEFTFTPEFFINLFFIVVLGFLILKRQRDENATIKALRSVSTTTHKNLNTVCKDLINLSSEVDKLRIFLCSAYFLTPDEVNSAYKQMQVSGTTLETANKLREQRNRFVAKAHEQHTNPGALDKIITGQMHFDGALALLSNRIAALEEELNNAKQIQE